MVTEPTPAELELAAKRHFDEHYEVVADLPFMAKRPTELRDPQATGDSQVCRFCKQSPPTVTFRSIAHAVPEFLGNRAIRSMNECDACNSLLAANYEDHLGRWSLFARAVSQVPGKGGRPTFKNPAKTLRVGPGETGLNIEITDPAQTQKMLQEGGPYKFTLPADATSPTYVPKRAAMALVKVACSICPFAELGQCNRAIDWLMGRGNIYISQFLVFYGFTPGPINDQASRAILLRRKTLTREPHLWCVIQSRNHRFQVFVPGCPADDDLFAKNGGGSFTARHYRIPAFGPDWPYGPTKYGRLDWSGEEPIRSSVEAVLHVEHAVRISPGDPEPPP